MLGTRYQIEDQEISRQAELLAARYDLPGAADSDAHGPEGTGAADMEMPGFDGPAEFFAALRQAWVTGEYPACGLVRTAAAGLSPSIATASLTGGHTTKSRSFCRVS